MSTPNNRRRDPGGISSEAILIWTALIAVVLILGSVYAAVHLGHRLAGLDEPVDSDPFAVFFGVVGGDVAWPTASTWVLVASLVLGLTLATLVAFAVYRLRRGRTRVDRAASFMGRGRDVEAMSRKSATATAKRLGVDTSPGVPIGLAVGSGAQLYGSWEDMHIDIWGPRTGKTTSRAVPAIVTAPGAVLVTSNKRDVVDATRGVRATAGPVWVFDPQDLALEEPTWWWNPLSYVTDEVRAARGLDRLAGVDMPGGLYGFDDE